MASLRRALLLAVPCALLRAAAAQGSGGTGAENVTFHEKPQYLYRDVSPTLVIKGKNFARLSENQDDLELTFDPPLEAVVDYSVSVHLRNSTASNDKIEIKKVGGRSWAEVPDDQQEVKLMLMDATLQGESLLDVPKHVATVIKAPMVIAEPGSAPDVSMTEPRIVIEGHCLAQKSLTLVFAKEEGKDAPEPLTKDVDYMLVDGTDTTLTLLLLPNGKWRTTPGQLMLKGIETLAGFVSATPPGFAPLPIANIVERPHAGEDVEVDQATGNHLYNNAAELTIKGTNLPTKSVKVAFLGGIKQGTDFEVDEEQSDSQRIVLKLLPGKLWRKQADTLPDFIRVKSIGEVDLGLHGRVVAKVYPVPTLVENFVDVHLSQTHEFQISGTGFVPFDEGTTKLTFDPPIHDVSVAKVESATNITVALRGGRRRPAWGTEAASLRVTAIDTGAGKIEVDVQVANLVEDHEANEAGIVVDQLATEQRVYPSKKKLRVHGEGFPKSVTKVVFANSDPPEDAYIVQRVSPKLLELELKNGKVWSDHSSKHTISVVKVNDVSVAGDHGVPVAVVYPPPSIDTSLTKHLYAKESREFFVKGSFSGKPSAPKVDLVPKPTSGTVEASILDFFTLRLRLVGANSTWAGVRPGETAALSIGGIDNGAGLFRFEKPVTVAMVYGDAPATPCDDTCRYANDGTCDDPLSPNNDDDGAASGFYGDDNTEGRVLCAAGTDCTDCGGVLVAPSSCDNSCKFAHDGHCDDPRGTDVCQLGTDCFDCGPVGAANFTSRYEDDDYWGESKDPYLGTDRDDDGDGFDFKDDEDLQESVDRRWDGWVGADGRHYVGHGKSSAEGDDGSTFLTLLVIAAWVVGLSVCSGGCLVLYYFRSELNLDGGVASIVALVSPSASKAEGGYRRVPTTERHGEPAAGPEHAAEHPEEGQP